MESKEDMVNSFIEDFNKIYRNVAEIKKCEYGRIELSIGNISTQFKIDPFADSYSFLSGEIKPKVFSMYRGRRKV